jgi:hypothetical protein
MTISEEILMAYADGELDAATRASIEAAMQEDPDIRKRVARHRALRETMRGAFSAVLDEPVPDRLIEAARGQTAAPRSVVADLSAAKDAAQRRKSAAPRRWQPAAMAASLLLGLGLGFLAWHGPGGASIQPGAGGGLVAGAALAEALSNQLSDDRSQPKVAVTGLSFRDKSGDYCRTFSLTGSDPSLGLACREGADWRIKALAQAPQRIRAIFAPQARKTRRPSAPPSRAQSMANPWIMPARSPRARRGGRARASGENCY